MEVESIVNSKRRSVKLEECFSVNASNTSNGSCTSSDTDSTLGHAALLGRMLGRKRKKFVGIRQRPSGRWVAEIKDTIQKIRLWLGTFDTAEDAARAYDEAACILRGKNTRTNFWPSPSAEAHGTSVLPSRTARMLQLRLKEAKARNNNDGMISDTNDTNSSMDHSLCNQFMHSKLNLEAEMPSLEEDNISETKTSQIHSLTPGMSSMDVILNSTVPNKPHAAANDSNEEKYLEDQDGFVNPSLPIEPNIRMGQRDANKGASQLVPTNPKRALPQFIQKTILNPRVVHTNPTKDFLQLVQKTLIIPRAVQRNPNEDFSQLLEDKDGSLNPSSPTINSRMGQRNPSNGAFEMIETNPNKELPQLLQKNYCSVEGGEEKGNLSSSSNLMETDDITPVECMNREDTHITSSLHGVITEMDNDFDFIDVSDLASGYSPFAIAEEMAEPVNTNSCMHNVFMVDEASGCNGFLQSLEEQHSSMFREAINRRMYERKISASLYAMIGVSEYFHYTSERS